MHFQRTLNKPAERRVGRLDFHRANALTNIDDNRTDDNIFDCACAGTPTEKIAPKINALKANEETCRENFFFDILKNENIAGTELFALVEIDVSFGEIGRNQPIIVHAEV